MSEHVSRRALLTASAAAALTDASDASATEGTLNGVWEGSLTEISATGLNTSSRLLPNIRLEIRENTARLFGLQQGEFSEIKPGGFQVQRVGTNAVISSVSYDIGHPLGTSWVETLVFAVTVKDTTTLTVNFIRVVNNNNMMPSEQGAQFSMMRTGELRRAGGDHV